MSAIVIVCAVLVFAVGYGSCYLIHVVRETPDACQPALDQLKRLESMKEQIAREEAEIMENLPQVVKEKVKYVKPAPLRPRWSENMPAKDDKA